MNGLVELGIILGSALGLMLLGLPIAASLGIVGFVGVLLVFGWKVAIGALTINVSSSVRHFSLVSVPMFILMAEILIFSDLTKRLFDNASKLLGGLPGSLLLGTRLATTLFSSLTGSSVASAAAIGSACIPEMTKRGYDRALTAGSVVAGGGLAIVMPPSIVLIVYGYVTEVSIPALFMAGVIPALIMSACYVGWNLIIALKRPDLAPRSPAVSPREWIRALLETGPFMALTVVVLGTIYAGFATVTEAAAIGVAGALFLAAFTGKLTISNMSRALLGTARITGFAFLILIGALMFAFLITYLKIPAQITQMILEGELSRWAVLALVMTIFLFLGTLMEPLPTILIVIPIVIGPLKALGFDPIWLGIILTVVLEMGLTMPPFGLNLFIVQGTAAYTGSPVTYGEVTRGCTPYLVADGVALAIIILFPATALWLPAYLN
jgi:tripartite ATP-independent transporter DctM subunit